MNYTIKITATNWVGQSQTTDAAGPFLAVIGEFANVTVAADRPDLGALAVFLAGPEFAAVVSRTACLPGAFRQPVDAAAPVTALQFGIKHLASWLGLRCSVGA